MAKRHENAWFIQQGACNVRGIARALVEAADEACADRMQPSEDAAVRLIVHQLAFLTNAYDSQMGYSEDHKRDVYSVLMDECTCRSVYAQVKNGSACEWPRKEG